jgi:hypothetical protein
MHEVGRVDFLGTYKCVAVGEPRLFGQSIRSPYHRCQIAGIAGNHGRSVSDDLEEGVHDVAVAGTLAYVAAGSRNLRIVNVSNPLAPVIIGTANTPGIARGVAVTGNYCLLADGIDLKVIARRASPSRCHPKISGGRLEVYDVMGRQVRVLSKGVLPAGSHEVMWDRRDSRGVLVPSGVYFYRLTAGDYQEEKKMVALRAP